MARTLDFPVFDADNHFYETQDSFTRHLPDRYKGAIDYVDVHGRTKIVIRGTISEYIPNPTFDVVARPGAQEEYFRNGNPEGKSYREIVGEPMRAHPRLPRAGPAPRADGRARRRPGADVPDAGQPARGAHARRPRADPRRHPRAQRVDVRGVDVQLRGPHLRDAGHHAPDRGEGDRGARVGGRAGRQDGPRSARPRCPATAARARSASPSSTRSGRRWSTPTSSSPCTRPTAATPGTRPTGPVREEMLPVPARPVPRDDVGKRPMEDTMTALLCHGVLSRFPELRVASIESGGDWVAPFLDHVADIYKQDAAGLRRGPGRAVQAQRLGQPVPRGQPRASSSTRSGPTTSSSARTTRTPRASPSRCSYVDHLPAGLSDEDVPQHHGRQPGAGS